MTRSARVLLMFAAVCIGTMVPLAGVEISPSRFGPANEGLTAEELDATGIDLAASTVTCDERFSEKDSAFFSLSIKDFRYW